MVDIALVRSNSIIHSPRVRKIVRSLSKKYSISILGWNREGISGKMINDEEINPKLFSLRAPIGKPSLVFYFPLYWAWVFFRLSCYRPSVVHACDLDSAIPSFFYKIIFKKKLVFDVCDRYAMGYIPTKYKWLYSLVNSVEELIAQKSDTLVNVSEPLLRTFRKLPRQCAIIMNCSEDYAVAKSVKSDADTLPVGVDPTDPDDMVEDDGILTMAYTGAIIDKRGLREVAEAIRDLHNVELIIAGNPVNKNLQDKLQKMPNIVYKGLLSHGDALRLVSRSDVVVTLYDLKDPISNFSMGNKVFEALMFGLPVITNVAPDFINKIGCGIIVNYDDIDRIKEAIRILRDDRKLRKNLGKNGRKAFLEKYNWTKMEHELYKIYDRLVA